MKKKTKIKNNQENVNSKNKFYWLHLTGFFVILSLPLLNLPPWFSPPDWGKTIIFRIILSLMIFLFIWQILYKTKNDYLSSIIQNISNKKSNVFLGFWLLIAVFGIFLLSTIFSQEPYFSFWGSPYRSGGFLNFGFYIIFAVLAFLLIKTKDWQKIWDFSIIIGIFVSFIAVFQQYGLFDKALIPYSYRPPSTIGGPIFLAIYLLLLCFLCLGFFINQKKILKRIFYCFAIILFLFTAIFITQTRAVMIGFFAGFCYFFLAYPITYNVKKHWNKKLLFLKIFAGIILILSAYGVYYVNNHTIKELPQFVQENKFLKTTIQRVSIKSALQDSRISGWQVSWEALKNKPILGYGMENFAQGFDEYYNPSLPKITQTLGSTGSGWWDRAHNFIFDISVTAGLPALIIYICLFGTLFFQLQKLKHIKRNQENVKENTDIIADIPVYHAIQAGFIGYFTANFFSFDTFSTYLISFMLIAFVLHLILSKGSVGRSEVPTISRGPNSAALNIVWKKLQKNRNITILLIFLCVIWFIWTCNIKPFQINTDINAALYQAKNNDCEKAIQRMEKISKTNTFLNNYLGLKYISIIGDCIKNENTETEQILAQRATEILKKNIEIRTTYTRNWLLLGIYTNYLIEKQTNLEIKEKLKQEADYYFERANQLSPKRQEILIEWVKTDFMRQEFQMAKQKSLKCIEINDKLRDCYWIMGLTNIYLGEQEQADKNINIAIKKGYPVNSELSLLQKAKAYIYVKDYQELIKIYQKLIKIKPKNPQYYASLATCYKEIHDFEKAKKYALKVLELEPKMQKSVEEFIKNLN